MPATRPRSPAAGERTRSVSISSDGGGPTVDPTTLGGDGRNWPRSRSQSTNLFRDFGEIGPLVSGDGDGDGGPDRDLEEDGGPSDLADDRGLWSVIQRKIAQREDATAQSSGGGVLSAKEKRKVRGNGTRLSQVGAAVYEQKAAGYLSLAGRMKGGLEQVPPEKALIDGMCRVVLLGQEFQVHTYTLRESGSKVLRRLQPTPECPHYMVGMSKKAEQQTYYLCQRPRAFEAVIMYIEGGALHPPKDMEINEFIDELCFYELKNIEEAISSFMETGSDQSDVEDHHDDEPPAWTTVDEKGNTVPVDELSLSWYKRWQKKVWDITDQWAYTSNSEVVRISLLSPQQQAMSPVAKTYAVISFCLLWASVVLFCVATLPIYREASYLKCTIFGGNNSVACDGDGDHVIERQHYDAAYCGGMPQDSLWQNGTCVCVERSRQQTNPGIAVAEAVFFVFFSTELILRFWAAPSKVKFVKSMMNWIDFLAIVPSLVEYCIDASGLEQSSDAESKPLLFFRALRLFRVFRLIRLSNHFAVLQIFAKALHASRIVLLELGVFVILVSVMFATGIYFIEWEMDDVGYGEFDSIPRSMWWALVTMTTLGYGDMVPQSVGGKLLGSFCALSGILVIALPVPVFVDNFRRMWEAHYFKTHMKNRKKEMMQTQKASESAVAATFAGSRRGSKPIARFASISRRASFQAKELLPAIEQHNSASDSAAKPSAGPQGSQRTNKVAPASAPTTE